MMEPSFEMMKIFYTVILTLAVHSLSAQTRPPGSDVTLRNFRFADGESLATLRMHYIALGAPKRDARGRVDNAVLILHGTTGAGSGFLSRNFAGELFGPGQLL